MAQTLIIIPPAGVPRRCSSSGCPIAVLALLMLVICSLGGLVLVLTIVGLPEAAASPTIVTWVGTPEVTNLTGGPNLPGYIHPPYEKWKARWINPKNATPDNSLARALGLHGNQAYRQLGKNPWYGTDAQGQGDKTVYAPFEASATPGSDPSGGCDVFMKGSGAWTNWVAHYIHLECSGRASGKVVAGDVVGTESVAKAHSHLILMWCQDPDNRVNGCLDVPVLALLPKDQQPDWYRVKGYTELAVPKNDEIWIPPEASPPEPPHK